jgi:hypothetical protein
MSDGEPGQPDEDVLRRAAEAGDVESAVELGSLLLDQERHEEGRSWLERAIHSPSGPEAAFHLGRSFYAQDRHDDAEATWLLAAHAGHLRGAMALATLLEETGRTGHALHWLREVAGSDDWWLRREAADRLAERRVTDLARTHAEREDWQALWTLVLSTPMAEAATAVEHIRRSGWRPAAPRDRAVAERLLAADREAIARVADRATRLSTRILPHPLDFSGCGAAELVGDDPVIAFSTIGEFDLDTGEATQRLYTLGIGGEPSELQAGPGMHSSFGLLGPRTVLSVCAAAGGRSGPIRWELLHIGQEGTEQIANGIGAPYPQLVTTRDGFVVGLQMSTQVIVGSGGQMGLVDLAPAGVRYRTSILAVDPTGTLVAFADEQVLFVVDARSWNVVATAHDLDRVHGHVVNLVFTTPERLVSSGPTGMGLWAIENGGLRPLTTNEVPRTGDLFAVPAWNVVGGMIDGSPRFFDDAQLDRVATPAGVIGREQGIIRRMCAAPGGRFVVYGGQLLVDEGRYDNVTAVHDLRHPLSWVHRPPKSLSEADRAELSAVLDGRPTPGAAHTLAADERQVLELVHAAAGCSAR